MTSVCVTSQNDTLTGTQKKISKKKHAMLQKQRGAFSFHEKNNSDCDKFCAVTFDAVQQFPAKDPVVYFGGFFERANKQMSLCSFSCSSFYPKMLKCCHKLFKY